MLGLNRADNSYIQLIQTTPGHRKTGSKQLINIKTTIQTLTHKGRRDGGFTELKLTENDIAMFYLGEPIALH